MFDIVILYTDGTWVCVEGVKHFETLKNGAIRLVRKGTAFHDFTGVAQIIIQPK